MKAVAKGLADKNGVMHTAQAEKAVIWQAHFGEKLHAWGGVGRKG